MPYTADGFLTLIGNPESHPGSGEISRIQNCLGKYWTVTLDPSGSDLRPLLTEMQKHGRELLRLNQTLPPSDKKGQVDHGVWDFLSKVDNHLRDYTELSLPSSSPSTSASRFLPDDDMEPAGSTSGTPILSPAKNTSACPRRKPREPGDPCPHCGSINTIKCGGRTKPMKRHCMACRKFFTSGSTPQVQKPKGTAGDPCPRCYRINTQRRGGTRRFCKDCNKSFTLGRPTRYRSRPGSTGRPCSNCKGTRTIKYGKDSHGRSRHFCKDCKQTLNEK